MLGESLVLLIFSYAESRSERPLADLFGSSGLGLTDIIKAGRADIESARLIDSLAGYDAVDNEHCNEDYYNTRRGTDSSDRALAAKLLSRHNLDACLGDSSYTVILGVVLALLGGDALYGLNHGIAVMELHDLESAVCSLENTCAGLAVLVDPSKVIVIGMVEICTAGIKIVDLSGAKRVCELIRERCNCSHVIDGNGSKGILDLLRALGVIDGQHRKLARLNDVGIRNINISPRERDNELTESPAIKQRDKYDKSDRTETYRKKKYDKCKRHEDICECHKHTLSLIRALDVLVDSKLVKVCHFVGCESHLL